MDEPPPTVNPWEERAERGFFPALWETWKLSVGRPTYFYRMLSLRGGLGGPLFYGFLVSLFGVWFAFFWQFLFTLLGGMSGAGAAYSLMGFKTQAIVTLFSPGIAVFTLFLSAAIFHGGLLLVGGARQGFRATFEIICYAAGPSLFTIVPFCGAFVGGAWSFALEIIGAREVHGISTKRAALAAVLPFLLLSLIGLFVALLMSTGGVGPPRY